MACGSSQDRLGVHGTGRTIASIHSVCLYSPWGQTGPSCLFEVDRANAGPNAASSTPAQPVAALQTRAKFATEKFGGLYSPLVPCAEANAKPSPKTFTLTATVAAGMDCIWKILDDWGNISWVQGSKEVCPCP